MKLSVIFITNRPGGMDILFNTLKNQTYKNFELIIVDDYNNRHVNRYKEVYELANKSNIFLKYHKSNVRHTYVNPKYRICSSMNDGLLQANGDLVVMMQDYCWIPENIFQVIVDFYSRQKNKNVLLSFAEKFYKCPEDFIIKERLSNNKLNKDDDKSKNELNKDDKNNKLSIFKSFMDKSPKELNWEITQGLNPLLVSEDIINKISTVNKSADHIFIEHDFWECYFGVAPLDVFKKANGFDERLDAGRNAINMMSFSKLSKDEQIKILNKSPKGYNDYNEKLFWKTCKNRLNCKIYFCQDLFIQQIDHTLFSKLANDKLSNISNYTLNSNDNKLSAASSSVSNKLSKDLYTRSKDDSGIRYGAELYHFISIGGGYRCPNNFDLNTGELFIPNTNKKELNKNNKPNSKLINKKDINKNELNIKLINKKEINKNNQVFKLSYIWDFTNNILQLSQFNDGFEGMLSLFAKDKEVELRVYTILDGQKNRRNIIPHNNFDFHCYANTHDLFEDVREFNPNYTLIWGDLTRPCIYKAYEDKLKLGRPFGLNFAGGNYTLPTKTYPTDIFVESETYYKYFKSQGLNVYYAFGTNTDLHKPVNIPKVFVASKYCCKAKWKNLELFGDASLITRKMLKNKGIIKQENIVSDGKLSDSDLISSKLDKSPFLVCGYTVPHEKECHENLLKKGVLSIGNISELRMAELINSSHCCVITSLSSGGSQRMVISAMSSNIPCIVAKSSEKCAEYLVKAGYSDLVVDNTPFAIASKIIEVLKGKYDNINTRKYILENYSHYIFYKNIKKIIYK